MTYNDFVFYFGDVVEGYYNQLKEIDVERYGGKAINLQNYKVKRIYYNYESMRKKIRKMYMADNMKPMDRHKIAATFMIAILKTRPIRVDRLQDHLPLELLLANEYVALYTALNLVENYRQDMNGGDVFRIIIPPTYIRDENADSKSYIQNFCKALYYKRSYKVEDVFSYANIFFMLEKYTDCMNNEELSSF